MPWLRRLVFGPSTRRHGLAPCSVRGGFVMDRVALGQIFLRFLRFYTGSIILSWLSILVYHLGDKK
jgi:hypothetical protein